MKKILAYTGLLILLLTVSASALQASYMYVSLSYGRGWWPWVCFNEHGVKGFGNPYTHCDARICPFEAGVMDGTYICGTQEFDSTKPAVDPNRPFEMDMVDPPLWGIVAKITIPEDLKLVTTDNRVVEDELCVGDKFKLDTGLDKGEYWQEGGNEDSPPIYWVKDVETYVDQIMAYHEKTNTTKDDICSNKAGIVDGFIDPLTGIPIYKIPVNLMEESIHVGLGNVELAGNMLCSIKKKDAGLEASDYYVVNEKKDIDINDEYVVECMYYYYGGTGGYMQMGGCGEECLKECPFETLKVPTVLQAGPDATVNDWYTHNIDFQSREDFFKIGEIGIKKKVNVVEPSKPKVEVSVDGADPIKFGASNTFRVLVKNTGDVAISIRKISSNVRYQVVSCDSDTVAPGASAECLLSITPEDGKKLDVSVDYKYKSCGRWVLANATKSLLSYTDLEPAASAQAYGFDVYGVCRNDYFGCDAPSRKGTFVAGYRCFNKDGKYFVPSIGRFDLKYDLSTVPKNKEILGARLYLNAKTVHKAQALTVYSTPNNKWSPAGCVPGGDICAQPWCKECLPLYDFAGKKESSVYVEGTGEYSLDVSDYVKSELGKGDKYASFQLMGQEDEWSTEGEKTCAAVGQWTSQEVEFYGSGDSGPYLEVVYR